MIVWINGTFGVGESTTAAALGPLARSRGSRTRIYDPEIFGWVLQRAIPRRLRPPDFRDQATWVGTTRWMVPARLA